MTAPSSPRPNPSEPLSRERRLAEAHGEDAAIYAEVRADAAQLRGAERDAERWDAVAEELARENDD